MHRPPRFIADAMLGSLARKLRIFGFDTVYFVQGNDADLETRARKEGRVILTSDRSLFEHSQARGLQALLVVGRTDRIRLLEVQKQTGVSIGSGLVADGRSRCAACNGELEQLVKRQAATTNIPTKVLTRHRQFYRCKSCSRLYWRGKHWKRLRRLSSSLKSNALAWPASGAASKHR